MDARHFDNPYNDYTGQPMSFNVDHVRQLMKMYVKDIVDNTRHPESRYDLYLGDAGIAYMFLRLLQTNEMVELTAAQTNASFYINRAKHYLTRETCSEKHYCAFLCGNAGIHAVAAAISEYEQNGDHIQESLKSFAQGFEVCRKMNFNRHNGSDELLVGRAGFLSGIYWLNRTLAQKPYPDEKIIEICDTIVKSGREYSIKKQSPFPLMYQYHSTEYLGAAHGISGILHMLLESPWYRKDQSVPFPNQSYAVDIKNTIDQFLALQDRDGNFPSSLDEAARGRNNLLHWCHGSPGAIYLLIKAYLTFREDKYLIACHRAADLIWQKGLLLKGPGICHGVAGNGYAFLAMYRLTHDPKYLYRAQQFANFLTRPQFRQYARTPDHPWSLYEGLAGTVCFLIDLIHPDSSSFPFMDVF